MINNRQGGRRRGRGGQGGGRNLGGQPGNRQDNRQRGNATQLLEKYKSMARDAQLAGDRVQTEYYLQYADHYFRVLSENRSRFEEQNPRRQRDDEMDEDEGEEEFAETADGEGASEDRPERSSRTPRPDRGRDRDRPRFNREERSANDSDEQPSAPSRLNGAGDSLPLDVLPPAIGRDDDEAAAAASGDEPRRPRRRTRAPRPADDDGEIAPAA